MKYCAPKSKRGPELGGWADTSRRDTDIGLLPGATGVFCSDAGGRLTATVNDAFAELVGESREAACAEAFSPFFRFLLHLSGS